MFTNFSRNLSNLSSSISTTILRQANSSIRSTKAFSKLLPDYSPWQPPTITIAITTRCNLRCTICTRTAHGFENLDMSRELFLRSSRYFSNKRLNIAGDGEPLLHPDLFYFMDVCRNRQSSISLVTNGTLLTSELSYRLLNQTNLSILAFSIDGYGTTYDSIRLGSSYKLVSDSLISLSKMRTSLGLKYPKLVVNFVGLRSNIEGLPDLVSHLGPYVDTIHVLRAVCYTKEVASQHLNSHVDTATRIFNESTRVSKLVKVELVLPNLFPRARVCAYPWASPNIGITGDIYPCFIQGCTFGTKEKHNSETIYYDNYSIILNKVTLGSIEDFGRDWNSPKFRQYRQLLSKANSTKYTNYKELLKSYSTDISFCTVCPSRWDTAC